MNAGPLTVDVTVRVDGHTVAPWRLWVFRGVARLLSIPVHVDTVAAR